MIGSEHHDPAEIERIVRAMIDAGALFVVNHSAGKDSQAMLIALRRFGVPNAQITGVEA